MPICDYGCGGQGKYKLTVGYKKFKWCCSPRYHSCPASRKRNSERQKDPKHRLKCKQKFKEKYGVEHHMHLAGIRNKIAATNIQRYGVVNPGQSTFIREKIKKTTLLRYGVAYVTQSESKKLKTKRTFQERYNGHPMQDPQIQMKVKNTLLEIYGVDNPGKTSNSIIKASLPKSSATRTKMRIASKPIEDRTEFELYKAQVEYWSKPIRDEYRVQGFIFGAENNLYQLDHIISKKQGFLLGIPPYIIGTKANCRILLGKENKSKNDKLQSTKTVKKIIKQALFERQNDL